MLQASQAYEKTKDFREFAPTDINCNPNTQIYPQHNEKACHIWARGDFQQCMDVLRQPYCYGVVGFAYISKPHGKSNAKQRVETLFFPRLHNVTATLKTHVTSTQYVVGNRNQFTGFEEPVYVKVTDLLNFTTLPSVAKTYQKYFDNVTDWKQAKFYDIVGDTWAKSFISKHNDNHTKEDTVMQYIPVSIPLSFG